MAPAPEFDAQRRLLTLPFCDDTCIRETLAAAARIMAQTSWSADCGLLLDCTGGRPAGLTDDDLEALESYLAALEENRIPRKIAFLVPPDPAFLKVSLLHAKLLRTRPGLGVGAFLSRDEALAWLTQARMGPNGEGGAH